MNIAIPAPVNLLNPLNRAGTPSQFISVLLIYTSPEKVIFTRISQVNSGKRIGL
jgi:hypothetical protein